ncbi:hypothetical protein [Terriglobus saanensis]|uniref:Uncharacterized protein n=1 Tax=Terriglobus saanensis (strain ATCC BAA-1853 / DSM 23119 / SP1PR4) TaxID=401053 RepID=E8UYY3_TERSS|nr:hypothetical protein [Terriglobus saanensis]ADV80928.1 hypothetical protein AciPR4_0087 [Terriglobus saanensis SP1PR4]
MQNTKDTFYLALRDRLALRNPTRTCVVRGQTRPAVLVEENELPTAEAPESVYRLRWTKRTTDLQQPMPLDTALCEIRYRTTPYELDRGREIDAMDLDLDAILQPRAIAKRSFSSTGATTLQTNLFWQETEARTTTKDGDRLAIIAVSAYREEGDL